MRVLLCAAIAAMVLSTGTAFARRNTRQLHGIASGRSYARPGREQRQTPFFWLGRDA
jgi:hypothetical protein